MKWAVIKHKFHDKLVLERNTLTALDVLTLDEEKCCGCGSCADVCPQEAITVTPAKIRDGRLERKPLVDFDPDRCVFCGECVALCPTNAINIEVEGEPLVRVIEKEVFPSLVKEITLNPGRCWLGQIEPDCNLACQNSCPREAIDITVESMGHVEIGRILDVEIDTQKCVYCSTCEDACPEGAIHVTKPFEGHIKMDTNSCPEGCRVCVDICPTKAISFNDEEKPVVNEKFCIYCGACREVCPEGCITVERTRLLHTEAHSGAWTTALEKLASHAAVVREVSAVSSEKRRVAVMDVLKSHVSEEN